MKKLFIILIFMLSFVITVKSQQVFFGISYTKNNETHVPIIFNNFGSITSISLVMNYDNSVLQLTHYDNINPDLYNGVLIYNNPPNQFRFSWFSAIQPITINDTLIELVFDNIHTNCSDLTWSHIQAECSITKSYTKPYYYTNVNFIDTNICVTNNIYPVVIEGSLKYHNTQSNVCPTNIYLYDEYGNYINQQGTYTGNFSFTNVASGEYIVDAGTTMNSGGYNATDALLIAKHFIHQISLDSIQTQAADADGNGIVNATDALIVIQHFVTNTTFFNPWIIKWKTFDAYDTINNITIETICKGDVDNSFLNTPAKLYSYSDISLEITKNENGIEVPIIFKNVPEFNALSLIVEYDGNYLKYKGYKDNKLNELYIMNVDNQIRMGWYDLTPITIDNNMQTLLFEVVKPGNNDIKLNGEISIDGNVISINFNNKIIEDVKISCNHNVVSILNTYYTNVQIYDILGKKIIDSKLNSGINNFSLDGNQIYLIKLISNTNIFTKKLKL